MVSVDPVSACGGFCARLTEGGGQSNGCCEGRLGKACPGDSSVGALGGGRGKSLVDALERGLGMAAVVRTGFAGFVDRSTLGVGVGWAC